MYESKWIVQRNSSEQRRVLVENPRVFVDFHNADDQGRLRLNCIGTIEDLAVQAIELRSGQQLTLYSEDLEVDGIVEYSNSEHLWVVMIDWDEIRQIEEVGSVQKRFLDVVGKLGSIIELLEANSQDSLSSDQDFTPHEREELLDEIKQGLKNVDAALGNKQEINGAVFYQQFASLFGEEEAEEIWSVRRWSTDIVLRDLALVLMDDPELRQNIEQKGFNFKEIIDMLSQAGESRDFLAKLPQTDQGSLARLRDVICC